MAIPRIIETCVKAWDSITYRIGVIASTFAIIMGSMVLVEVIARRLFFRSTYIVYDVVEFLFAGMIFLGLAETHRAQAHIRIDTIINHLPVRVRRFLLEVIFPFIICVYVSFLFSRAVSLVISSYQAGTKTVSVVELKVWPAQALMALGLLIFAIMAFLYFLHGCCTVLGQRRKSPPASSLDRNKAS